jgi:hypothetical protein
MPFDDVFVWQFITLFLFFSFACLREILKDRTPVRIRDLKEAISILEDSTLESRAIPNQRLVATFGIKNSFTTTNTCCNKSFIAKANRLLQTSEPEWDRLAKGALWIVSQSRSPRMGDPTSLPLVDIVQALVFRIVLMKFFPDLRNPTESEITMITKSINTRWTGSKSPSSQSRPAQVQAKAVLDYGLRRVFQLDLDPSVPIDPRSNPLNILLPTYDALWPVVLSGFLELRFHSQHRDAPKWRKQLERFLSSPSRSTFEAPEDGMSIEMIVAEMLRLYPPMKRINRVHNHQTVGIDVEFLHRDPEIWGTDAEVFEPARWTEDGWTKDREMAYMPFGKGKFVCPSRAVVGPMLIGILVAALLRRFDEKFQVTGPGSSKVVFGTEPLKSERDAYAQLKLKKV